MTSTVKFLCNKCAKPIVEVNRKTISKKICGAVPSLWEKVMTMRTCLTFSRLITAATLL